MNYIYYMFRVPGLTLSCLCVLVHLKLITMLQGHFYGTPVYKCALLAVCGDFFL